MKKAKIFTIINYLLSDVLWLLGILTFVFNALGLWTLWNLAGFAFMIYIPIPAVSQFLSIIFCDTAQMKLIKMNVISLVISVIFILLTVWVSTKWFW